MPKLVYVYGDDNKMLDTLVTSLRNNGIPSNTPISVMN